MKKIILLLSFLFLTGCSSLNTNSKNTLEITRADEFIDISTDSVKLLFKTEIDSDVTVYLGKDKKNLIPVEEIKNYNIQDGIEIKGLKSGESYFYKIISRKDGRTAKSDIETFTKSDRKNIKAKAEWARTAIFYEVFVRSFYDSDGNGIGDFKGVEEKLDYLKELGVDALWLMPIMDSPSYHGYDTQNYYAVEPDYGTMEEFENMVKAAHNKGIKVTIDMVLNHTSSENPMFKSFVAGREYNDFYVWSDRFDDTSKPGLWQQNIWHEIEGKKYLGIFVPGMPDLNYGKKKVRDEAKKIAKFWIEKGVDGFRLDATPYINHENSEVTHNWWQEFNEYVKSINSEVFIVGECTPIDWIAPYFKDMDSSFDFKLNADILEFLKGKDIDIAGEVEKNDKSFKNYSDNYINTTFLSNHDIARIAYALKGDKNKIKMAAVMLMTLPGAPYIYYGEEIGQKGAGDEPARAPFKWYADNKGSGMTTWMRSGLNKANDGISVEEQKIGDTLLNYYKKLIKIRKENKEMFTAIPKKINTPEGIYGYESIGKEGKIFIILNKSKEDKNINIKDVTGEICKEILEEREEVNGEFIIKAGESLIFK